MVFATFFALVLGSTGAGAATLNVVGGQLMGASNVDVGGTLYDVAFLDGTCIALFSGCNDPSDFTFNTHADALLASQALLDQVFLDGSEGLFDTTPELTNGCTSIVNCFSSTTYSGDGIGVSYILTINDSAASPLPGDPIRSYVLPVAFSDTSDIADLVHAVWTSAAPSVPEPGTGLLVGLGLLVMGVRRRRID